MSKHIVLLAVAIAAVPVHSAPTDLTEKVRTFIGNTRGLEAPGCAVSVQQNGKIVLFVADGAADLAANKPINADTQFYMASVAKQFTALAVAQLVVAEKIGLDADIREYLPEMPQYLAPITVAMLLHHTSGIRDMLGLGVYAGYESAASASRAESLKLVMTQPQTNFVPGSQFRYSNSGYLLLSEIVERASGVPFAVYMKENVFAPMGMKRTMVLAGARTTQPNAAHGYIPDGSGFKLADTHPLYGGAGGAVSTINDLAKYDYDINVAHKIWTPAIAKIMLAPGTLTDGTATASSGAVYAGGLSLNGPWIQHGGAGEGFKNMVAWLPDGKLSIHILCNNGALSASTMAEKVIDTFAGYPSIRAIPPSIAGRYASAELPVQYVLEPKGEDRLTVTIEPQAGGLGRQRTIELTKAADGSFNTDMFKIVLDNDRRGFALGGELSRAGTLRFRRVD